MFNCDEQKTLRSYLADTNIFNSIKTIESFPFLEGDSADDLNMMLKINYGQKIMFSVVADLPVADAAKYIVKNYSDSWNKLLTALDSDFNIAANAVKVTSGKGNSSGTKTDDRNSSHKVSAFNSDELLPDSGDTENNVETSSNETTNTGKEENLSLKSLFDNLPLIERTNIINIVLKDVSNYLTISVY